MANTYSQLYIQVVFAVQNRNSLIQVDWEGRLHKYITGIVQKKNQKMLAINGMPDHMHFLIGMKPDCCLSDLVREIKKSSHDFIKENALTKFNFKWQDGYGAFSYGQSQLDKIIAYIMNQKQHHKKKTFREEYINLLNKFKIIYEDKYVFDFID